MALAKIATDELGITAGIKYFTSGDLSACGKTALNILGSLAGGLAGKLAAKYALPWKWKKAYELGKGRLETRRRRHQRLQELARRQGQTQDRRASARKRP
ncbi:hypothetical protein AB0K18_48165 [Nonomuraea sp. NPDC049421]|uniref:hypothetical protein n=1 Tax=Nonomuraea sp. NPDC049421 TaxID=3155275 RepID=UPI003431B141